MLKSYMKNKVILPDYWFMLKNCSCGEFVLDIDSLNYRPQGKVMFSQVSVCPQGRGGCLPSGKRSPLDRDLLGRNMGQDRKWHHTPSWYWHLLWPLQRLIRILLECILVLKFSNKNCFGLLTIKFTLKNSGNTP